ncbi:hypothetical protein PIB30_036218 [Stylosanthes scabra]|uniref:Peptidase S9 prolyl oligopeptidase catalytic domain-containing protein n=1 Tax=Stylosanthes scabra TaxID=79078 RepID=A0ABU6UC45_9FABA|nr:hypothetical protein [Stylosanthes scabra]
MKELILIERDVVRKNEMEAVKRVKKLLMMSVAGGKVDRERLCIKGGYAGGYTAFAALAFRDTFKAGLL